MLRQRLKTESGVCESPAKESTGLQVTALRQSSPFELTKGLEHSKVTFNDGLSRWGWLCVSQGDPCVTAQERRSARLRGGR